MSTRSTVDVGAVLVEQETPQTFGLIDEDATELRDQHVDRRREPLRVHIAATGRDANRLRAGTSGNGFATRAGRVRRRHRCHWIGPRANRRCGCGCGRGRNRRCRRGCGCGCGRNRRCRRMRRCGRGRNRRCRRMRGCGRDRRCGHRRRRGRDGCRSGRGGGARHRGGDVLLESRHPVATVGHAAVLGRERGGFELAVIVLPHDREHLEPARELRRTQPIDRHGQPTVRPGSVEVEVRRLAGSLAEHWRDRRAGEALYREVVLAGRQEDQAVVGQHQPAQPRADQCCFSFGPVPTKNTIRLDCDLLVHPPAPARSVVNTRG